MRLWKSWIVTQKDLSTMSKNKYVFYSLIGLPVLLGTLYPVIFIFALNSQITSLTHAQLLAAANQSVDIASVFLVIIPAFLPSYIASYSFVGEKIEKSLEPLLATPTTDGELLLGKCLAAFLPCMGVTYVGAAISASILDAWSYTRIGVFLIPNLYWILTVIIIAPLACVLSVEANVIVSSKVNDIRAAQQLGGLSIFATDNSDTCRRFKRSTFTTFGNSCLHNISRGRCHVILLEQGNISKGRNSDKMEMSR